MLSLGYRRRTAPGMLIAAVLAGGLCNGPAFADGEWLVSWAKPAIDPLAKAPKNGAHSIAYGENAVASGANSIAFGDYATASGDNSIAFGYWARATGDNSLAMGAFSRASGLDSMALGISSTASGDNSTGIGSYSHATGPNSTAIGVSSAATGENTSAVGNGSIAAGDNSTALGVQAVAKGDNTTAVGNHAAATGDNSVATGVESTASGVNTTAVGNHSKASGKNSSAVGILSKATGDDATALGNQANAAGTAATAIGTQARATGDDSTAIGNQAQATGNNSLAIGSGAKATGDNSIAIGDGSIATGANTVSFGTPDDLRRLTNIADGVAATDAATVHQLNLLRAYVDRRMKNILKIMRKMKQAALRMRKQEIARRGSPAKATPNGRREAAPRGSTGRRALAARAKAHDRGGPVHGRPRGRVAALDHERRRGRGQTVAHPLRVNAHGPHERRPSTTGTVDYGPRPSSNPGSGSSAPLGVITSTQLRQAVAALNSRIDDVETHANRGIAAAAAMAPVLMPSQPGKTSVSMAGGYYRGEGALSITDRAPAQLQHAGRALWQLRQWRRRREYRARRHCRRILTANEGAADPLPAAPFRTLI